MRTDGHEYPQHSITTGHGFRSIVKEDNGQRRLCFVAIIPFSKWASIKIVLTKLGATCFPY